MLLSIKEASYHERCRLRSASDDVALLCSTDALPEMRAKFQNKQAALGRFRGSLANLVEAERLGSAAKLPERLPERRKTQA